MKKLFKTIGSTVLRIGDNALLGGAITNVIEKREDSPKGHFDLKRFLRVLIPSTIPVVLLLGIALKWWTAEEAVTLFGVFG